MNPSELSTSGAILLTGLIFAGVQVLLQLGDRLWGPKVTAPAGSPAQATACHYQHQMLAGALNELREAQRDMLRAHADLLRSQSNHNAEVIRRLDAVEERLRELAK